MMTPKESDALNQREFDKLKPQIDANYPPGQFVALYGGKIICDAKSFDELERVLIERGHTDPDEVLVDQAGLEHHDFLAIL